MKVLWFTNTSCSLAKKIKSNSFGGGWMEALENGVNKLPNIELYISFYNNKQLNSIEYENSVYYPALREKNYIKEIRKRIFNQFNEDQSEIDRLVDIVNKINPNIIHIHGTEDNFGLIQKVVSQPVVISIQGIINPYFEKYFSGIPKVDVKRNEPFRSKIRMATQHRGYLSFRSMAKRELKILQMSKHVIGRTSWDRRVTSILSQNGKYYHIDELLRPDFYEQSWSSDNTSTEEFKIYTTTSNSIYKGFETIIKTALLLKNIKGNFSWHIVGLSENDSVVKITLSWMKINLKDVNVVLHGKLPPAKFIPIMLSSNVFCQTSHIENSPNSICEAMCLGMPVVATFAGGTESMLENNKEGILVQDGDPFSLAGAILELKNNSEKAIKMADNARIRAIKRHNYEKVVNELVSLYEHILGEVE